MCLKLPMSNTPGKYYIKKVMLLEELWLLSGNGDKAPDFTKQEMFFSQNIY